MVSPSQLPPYLFSSSISTPSIFLIATLFSAHLHHSRILHCSFVPFTTFHLFLTSITSYFLPISLPPSLHTFLTSASSLHTFLTHFPYLRSLIPSFQSYLHISSTHSCLASLHHFSRFATFLNFSIKRSNLPHFPRKYACLSH